jgi:hypothetical protein
VMPSAAACICYRVPSCSPTALVCALVAAPVVVLQGKVCLMQRGTGLFAEKVVNCLNGGGVAAIIFARCATKQVDTYSIRVHQLMQTSQLQVD